jgi:predicted amidohydrolase
VKRDYLVEIRVGVLQTSLDYVTAWPRGSVPPKMSASEEEIAARQIQRGMSEFRRYGSPPHIILLPELAVPRGFISELERLSEGLGSVVIAGVDYRTNARRRTVKNEGAIIVPRRWRSRKVTFGTTTKYFGKTYPAEIEKREIEKAGYSYSGSPIVWLFDGREMGTFGVCICYDLMDLERLALYRARLQHLFVIAYNRDLTSFQHIAEAAARLLFCNVVICNTGHYGGSLAIAPYYDPARRIIFQQMGANLFTNQAFGLHVRSLAERQMGIVDAEKTWKSLPPGFDGIAQLNVRERALPRPRPAPQIPAIHK